MLHLTAWKLNKCWGAFIEGNMLLLHSPRSLGQSSNEVPGAVPALSQLNFHCDGKFSINLHLIQLHLSYIDITNIDI